MNKKQSSKVKMDLMREFGVPHEEESSIFPLFKEQPFWVQTIVVLSIVIVVTFLFINPF